MILVVSSLSVFCEPVTLTQAQRTKLKKMAMETKAESERLRRVSHRIRKTLDTYYDSYNIDEAAIKASINKLSQTQQLLLNIHLKVQKLIRKVVTKEQFQAFSSKFNGNPHKKHGPRFLMTPELDILRGMRLSAKQMRKAQTLLKLDSKAKTSMDQMFIASNILRNVYIKYDLDENSAKKLINTIHSSQDIITNIIHKKQVLLRTILTKEQFKTYQEQRSRFHHIEPGFGGPGGPHPRPPRPDFGGPSWNQPPPPPR